MIVSGAAQIAGVMGWPVDHSLSPRLHGYWLDFYGIDGAYIPLAVHPDRPEDALRALPALGFAGANLTMPYKEEALNSLISATIRQHVSGQSIPWWFDPMDRSKAAIQMGMVALIGAGGAARAVCVTLQEAGSSEIRIINRTAERAGRLACEFGSPIITVPWAERTTALEGVSLLVNATTLGMHGQPSLDLDLDLLPRSAVVTDIVYTPLKTALLHDAETRGNRIVDGLSMLLHQARPGLAAYFDCEPEVTTALREHVMNQIENLHG